jgi:hypothetical protein
VGGFGGCCGGGWWRRNIYAMRFLAREAALDVLGEENCVSAGGGRYICGIDYLMVKRFVIADVADNAFGFVGDVPILGDVGCERYLMYYGVPGVLFNERFVVPGWKTVESQDSVVVYNCIDDIMEFYEVESFVFYKVPLSIFGFGLAELYVNLIDLLRKKSLYMVRFLY